MDIDKINNWSFAGGFEAASQAGFSEEEMHQLHLRWARLCDDVLANRLGDIPRGIRDLIDCSARIDYPIPYRPPDITPDRCYFILPVRHGENSDENQVLLLSPTPGRWALTTWKYSSGFIDWLVKEGDDFASGWIGMMIGEFGLRDDMLGAWVRPSIGGSILDIRAHARFWQELKVARCRELKKRLVDAAEWVDGMGIPKRFPASYFFAISPSEIDCDPERTVFVIPFVLIGRNCSLVFVPERKIPVLHEEALEDIKLRLKSAPVAEQQQWVKTLLEE